MFWGKSKPPSQVPKTPKMTSVSLPDERYTPIPAHIAYLEKPARTGFFRRFSTEQRATIPMIDSWNAHHEYQSERSRARTVSTSAREVKAPRPIRPHPSQGPFIPVLERTDRRRTDFPRTVMAPVGVPSAEYLEEQIRRQRAESRLPHLPVDMLNRPDYEYPEERRLKEVAKRTGAKITRGVSKAWNDELEQQKMQADVLNKPSAPPMHRKPTKSWIEDPKDDLKKKPVDFKEWKAVPLEMGPAKQVTDVDPKAPLKSALKKTPSIKRPDSSRENKAYNTKGYYSEDDTEKRKEDKYRPPRVSKAPSKAFLEEQQERLEESRRGWSSNQYVSSQAPNRPSVHDIRPVLHPTHSSSTSSPDSIISPYDRNVRRNRSRHGSFSEQQQPVIIPSNYVSPYIKEDPSRNRRPSTTVNPLISTHGILNWPLVDYQSRRREGQPSLYFDVAYSPVSDHCPIKVKRGPVYERLTREEMEMPMCLGLTNAPEACIWAKNLQLWPVTIDLRGIRAVPRVIDVFMRIYETYSHPLFPGEVDDIGPEYIQRCQRAFKQRCEDSPDYTHNEERRGMRRVDMLRGRRIFKGLVPRPGQPHHYDLIFDDGT